MSQAPVRASDYQGADKVFAEATAELNRQVDEGTSWSGNERNQVFLNLGDLHGENKVPRFADISAVAGFDLPDDSRALVSLDWDHDGDLDIITTNRTAPRLRIFENRHAKRTDSSLAIKLQEPPPIATPLAAAWNSSSSQRGNPFIFTALFAQATAFSANLQNGSTSVFPKTPRSHP